MYTRILVPVDGSPTAARGLQEALGLARALDAAVVVLHVVEYVPVMLDPGVATLIEQASQELHAEGRRVLEAARDTLRQAGIASESHLADAGVARVCDLIVANAREHRCDLIVMGTHGRRGVQRALLGSDAEAVLRTSPVPVLLVRTAGPD